jgi:hypothetical protein
MNGAGSVGGRNGFRGLDGNAKRLDRRNLAVLPEDLSKIPAVELLHDEVDHSLVGCAGIHDLDHVRVADPYENARFRSGARNQIAPGVLRARDDLDRDVEAQKRIVCLVDVRVPASSDEVPDLPLLEAITGLEWSAFRVHREPPSSLHQVRLNEPHRSDADGERQHGDE